MTRIAGLTTVSCLGPTPTPTPHAGTLIARKPGDPLDGAPLAVGLVTVLRQFHPSYTRLVRAPLQHVRSLC